MVDMNMYEAEFSERGADPRKARLLIMAVSQDAADEWATAHAAAHDLEVTHRRGQVRDTDKWVKDNGPSVDLANPPADFPPRKVAGK